MGLGAIPNGELDHKGGRGTGKRGAEHGATGIRLQGRPVTKLHRGAVFVDMEPSEKCEHVRLGKSKIG